MAHHKPPFTLETAHQKVKAAQALWNTQTPSKVTQAYTPTSIWRNRSTFLRGHAEIEEFLTRKWEKEKEYRLRKELFAQQDNRIAVQFWVSRKHQSREQQEPFEFSRADFAKLHLRPLARGMLTAKSA